MSFRTPTPRDPVTPAALRPHAVVLAEGDVRLRPFTEDDWDLVAPWFTDRRVLHFSDCADDRTMAECQAIYRSVSRAAEVFVIEWDGVAVGVGWLQEMNLPRIVDAFPGLRTSRIDLQLAHDVWGQGIGSRAIRLLTAHAFARGDDLVFAVDIWDFNERSRRPFLRCGYVPWRRGASVHDLICRPAHFHGTAPVRDHPGPDGICAADAPYGAVVVVYRRVPELEVLLLHRARMGLDHQGDWAWTPPAGARYPAEPIDECAARELHEEVGLELPIEPIGLGELDWFVYRAEAAPDAVVALDDEHDRFEWLAVADAVHRCRPAAVAASIVRALAL